MIIHLWAGISMKEQTDLVMFDATLYVRILREALIPSARRLYPGGNYSCRTMSPNIHLDVPGSSLLTMGLSGGKHHQSLPISIPSRLSGMNLRIHS